MRKYLFCLVVVVPWLFLSFMAWAGTQATSGKTAASIIAEAQQDLNDSTSTFYTEDESLRWMNQALGELTTFGRCLEGQENATILDGVMGYTLSTAHYDVETVLYDTRDSSDAQRYLMLEKIDLKDIWDLPLASGRPVHWFEWQGQLNVWPIPGSDQNGTTLTAFMIVKPDELAATTDLIPTPYYYDPALLLYMKAKFNEKDLKEGKASYYRNLFYEEIRRYRTEVRKKLPGLE